MIRTLDELEAAFEAANVRVGEATWNVYSGEGEPDLEGAQRELTELLLDPAARALVEVERARADADADPIRARRLEIWRRTFLGAAVESAPEIASLRTRLQERIASFRLELDGRQAARSELQRVVRTDPDRDRRRRAWRATARLAEANRDELRRLMALRNGKARELGFWDYPALVFDLQELEESWVIGTLDRIALQARPVYGAAVHAMADRIGVPTLAPWDVPYGLRLLFQLADGYFPAARSLEVLWSTATALGFALDRLPIRALIRDIPFGGYNVAVRIPSDTRFLVNPSEGHGFYTTTFHEFGHSLQAVFTKTPAPILKEYEWAMGAHTAAYSEGMAEVLGEFAKRPDWLRSFAAVPNGEIERYTRELLPAQMAVRFFELFLNFRVELAAYREEGAEMAERERALTREVRLLDFPEEEPPLWEANTWYTSYPVYWQNYILAAVLASQVHETITARLGPDASSDPRVAPLLCERFYRSGNALPWQERVRRGTGSPLTPEPFLRRVIGP